MNPKHQYGFQAIRIMHVSYWTNLPRSTQFRQMKPLWWILATTLLLLQANAEDSAFWGFEEKAKVPFQGMLWQAPLADFSEDAYAAQVNVLLASFEETTGKKLSPGPRGKAALKIYTNSGLGLNTPTALVVAVIDALERRGFSREDLCLVDAREDTLRDAGFLPPLSRMQIQGPTFHGVRVYSLDSMDLRSPVWFYESPLPREFSSPLGRALLRAPIQLNPEEARKSYLPSNLVTEVDFWINMPMAAHHPATGLSGALVNASLWNISNGTRFFSSPANAPVAVAEIASIPELQAGWALNLVSLEGYQFIGGPSFNANYTESLPELWMSVDPVIMDANLITLLNQARRNSRFRSLPVVPEFIEYSVQLGLGMGIAAGTRVLKPARPPE